MHRNMYIYKLIVYAHIVSNKNSLSRLFLLHYKEIIADDTSDESIIVPCLNFSS